jgi:PAS domain S-box-containing protein
MTYRLILALQVGLVCLAARGETAPAASADQKSVLILNSYHPGFAWTDDLMKSIGERLRRSFKDLELHVEYMDVKHFEERRQAELFREFLPAKYRNRRVDLIIATDDAALAFLAKDGAGLFPGAPVVFCGVSDTELIRGLDRDRFTGVQELFNTRALVQMAKRLRPRAEQMYVVLDASEQNHAFVGIFKEAFGSVKGVEPVFLLAGETGLEGIRRKLGSVAQDSIVIANSFTQDRGGVVVEMEKAMEAITGAARAPVISPNSSVLGQGLLAGNANGGLRHGAFTAQVAERVLRGERVRSIPIEPEGGFGPVFDYAAMQRWGIGEEQLPPEAEVLNRPVGLWAHYRQYVVIALVLMTAQMGVIGLLVGNIRARRKAEAQLRESELRHKEMVENAIDSIYSHDLEGRYISVNRTLAELLGYTREELLSMNIDQIVAPEYIEAARRSIARKLANGKMKPTPYEIVAVCKDGRRIWVEVSTRLIRKNGKPVGVEGIARDITVRKRLEIQLRQAQKMDALGRLAGGVAHDFNNLLTVICGYANLLIPETRDSRQRERLELIGKAGEQAARLTQQLLAFSRSQAAEPAPVDLNRVVKDMEKMLMRMIGEDVRLVTELAPGLGSMMGDAGHMGQVVMNLAVNARDAMPAGGTLSISTSNVTRSGDGTYTAAPGNAGTHVMLRVSDTGTGMDPEVVRQAFEPFYTTKEQGKGTGLGLSVVYGIVKQYDGEISVASEPGRGTTFRISFPQAGAEARAEVKSSESGVMNGRGTVLVVEDREDVRRYAASVLTDAGYEVLAAAHGAEALAMVAGGGSRPDVLLTDVIMPGMSGVELADRLAESLPNLRVVLMSGYTAGAEFEDKYSRLLAKPFSPVALLERVREELGTAGCR